MLNLEQERIVGDKITKAKELLAEAIVILKSDWDKTFEHKDMSDPDGSAWLNIIGNISNKVVELEQCLEIDSQVAKSFEERLGDSNANANTQ